MNRPLRSRFIRWNDAESVPCKEDSTGRKGHEEDLLSNRGSRRFDKPLHPSGIFIDLFSYLRILNTHYTHIMTEYVRYTAREDNGIGVDVARRA